MIFLVTRAVKFLQLYVWKDRGLVQDVIKKAKAGGFNALALTADFAVGIGIATVMCETVRAVLFFPIHLKVQMHKVYRNLFKQDSRFLQTTVLSHGTLVKTKIEF